jgi:hypothetical protein
MKDIFWTDLLKSFFELKTKEKIPLNVDSIIWYNSSLKNEGKTLFYKELFDNNIIFIKDILDEENKFKTYDELKNQLNCNLKLISVSISDFHLEMPFIESTSKFSSGLSLLYISFDNFLEFRNVLINWLLYSVFVMLVTFLLLINCHLNTSDIDNITMKDIFWTDLLKSFFELKTKEKIPLNVDSIIWYNSSLKNSWILD